MFEAEDGGMQGLPFHDDAPALRQAVGRVADQRMPDKLHVDANLVRSSRFQLQLD